MEEWEVKRINEAEDCWIYSSFWKYKSHKMSKRWTWHILCEDDGHFRTVVIVTEN